MVRRVSEDIFPWASTYKEREAGRKEFWKQSIPRLIRMWPTCSLVSLHQQKDPLKRVLISARQSTQMLQESSTAMV